MRRGKSNVTENPVQVAIQTSMPSTRKDGKLLMCCAYAAFEEHLMLAVLSPAKALDFSPTPLAVRGTEPVLIDDARMLMRTARGLTQKRIRELMNLSPELAKLNYERYRSFELPSSKPRSGVLLLHGTSDSPTRCGPSASS